jgi:predicted dehydrogenase
MRQGVLLVGLGAIGMGYDLGGSDRSQVRTHARAFRSNPAFELLAGVDPDPTRQGLFETNYEAPAYGSVEAALVEHNPAVVVIACPTPAHVEVLNRVLSNAQPRAVLCEKPLAYDLTGAQSMVRACQERGVALYVNYMRRADPAVTAVKQMIESGEITGPLKAVLWYSKGLIHNGSHFVDLVRHWLGEVRSVDLMSGGRRWEGRDPEPDFLLECARGAVYGLAAREECFSHYTLEIVAQNGRLRYERGGDQVEWQGVVDDPGSPGYQVLAAAPRRLASDMSRSQLNVTGQLARALAGEHTTLCGGSDALQTLQDIHRVIELL